jgi:Na+/melibiose symporter-like transporter
VAIFAPILLSAWRTHGRIPYLAPPDPASRSRGVLSSLWRDLGEALRERPFRALFLGTTLSFTAWGVATALGLHVGTYFWRASTGELVLWGAGAGTGIFAGLAHWNRVAQRGEKKQVFVRGLAIFTLFTAAPLFAKLAGLWPAQGSAAHLAAWILSTGLVAHFGIAATMVTGRAMMADVTDEDALRHGRRREGVFFGAISFAAKAFFGVGSLIAGLVVEWSGLPPRALPESVAPQVVRDLGLALALSIALLVGLSIACFARYDLTRARHAQVRRALEAREGATAQ